MLFFKYLNISNFSIEKVSEMNFTFHGCINLHNIKTSYIDVDIVPGKIKMFYNCINLPKKDFINFNLK